MYLHEGRKPSRESGWIASKYFVCARCGVMCEMSPSAQVTNESLGPRKMEEEVRELKHQALELGSRRAALEADMQTAVEYLRTAGVGMHAPLVDEEGFPRSDVDVIAVRKARNFVARGRNDLKELELKLEDLLASIHERTRSAAREQMAIDDVERAAKQAAAAEKARRMQIESEMRAKQPFLRVGGVDPRGPGHLAGLEVGDLIVAFGTVEKDECARRPGGAFEAMGMFTREHEGRIITVWVLRGEDGGNAKDILELTLVPQRGWGGDGLLGCSFEADFVVS